MSCCDWDTFKDSFLAAWSRAFRDEGHLLIDWKKARKDWNKHHMTGGESASSQINEIKLEAPFIMPSRKANSCPAL